MPEVLSEVSELFAVVCPGAVQKGCAILQRGLEATDKPHHLIGLLKKFPSHGNDILKAAEATKQKFGAYFSWADGVRDRIQQLRKICEDEVVDGATVSLFPIGYR